jgi:hypothetical protein
VCLYSLIRSLCDDVYNEIKPRVFKKEINANLVIDSHKMRSLCMCNELPLGSPYFNLTHVAKSYPKTKTFDVQYVWACDVLVHLIDLCATKPIKV